MYNLNNFPEGTKVTQRYFRQADIYRGGRVPENYDGGQNMPTISGSTSSLDVDLSQTKTIKYMFYGLLVDEDKPIDLSSCTEVHFLLNQPSQVFFSKENEIIKGKRLVVKNVTSALTNMSDFTQCQNAEYDIVFENCDFSGVKNMNYILNSSNSVRSLGAMNVPNVTSANNVFNNSQSTFTDFGGFIDLKLSITSNGLKNCPNLTRESCINVLNGLYDFTGNGQTPASNQGKLQVHQNFINAVGDDINIGLNKGWTITV